MLFSRFAALTMVVVLSLCSCTPGDAPEYTLAVEGQETDEEHVQLDVRTNIPGEIEVLARLHLAGQDSDDVSIGKSERMRVRDGMARTTFDVSELPRGKYVVQASFHPNWGFRDQRSKKAEIRRPIESSHSLSLEGSGEPAEAARRRVMGRRWVMRNLTKGMAWKPSFWRNRYGKWKKLPVTTRNPDVISNYYFSSLDMTVVVNTLKGEIVVWQNGRGGL